MAYYKLLKGIAAGMANSFISRNNDIDGYWGIGLIYSEVNELGSQSVKFSLWNRSSTLPVKCSDIVIKTYREVAEQSLIKQGFAPEEVVDIEIELIFNHSHGSAWFHPPETWGDPFRCCVTVTDIYNAKRFFTVYGSCGLHDPTRERRSIRRLPYAY